MLTNNFRKFIADESGATAIEYGLIAALVSVAAIFALGAMGDSLVEIFEEVCTQLTTAVGPDSTVACTAPAAPPTP